MAYGDVYFDIYSTGSTATSAATAHLLFGSYAGLSLINQNEVVNLQVVMTVADARIWDSTVTNNTGLRLSPSASAWDFPPMRAAAASTLHFVRDAATDATANWTVWVRVPGGNK